MNLATKGDDCPKMASWKCAEDESKFSAALSAVSDTPPDLKRKAVLLQLIHAV